MKIETLKELQKVIALCRRQGVAHIKLGELEMTLGPMPNKPRTIQDFSTDFPEANIQVPTYSPIPESTTQSMADKIATDELTQEQLLFYSAQGHVEQ